MEPGKAEVAFIVIDAYQGHGIGAALLRHLAAVARAAEKHRDAEVFKNSSLYMTTINHPEVVQVTLQLT